MTEEEIRRRLRRVYVALGDKSHLKPEDAMHVRKDTTEGLLFSIDFTGGRSPEELEIDAFTIINEIMGIRDRAKAWIKANGGQERNVDDFVRANLAPALVHDLANSDKHGQLDRPPYSGYRPVLKDVGRGVTLVYDPSTGKYCAQGEVVGPVFDIRNGEIQQGTATSSGVEVVLSGRVENEAGNEVAELQKLIPDAIYKWEQFLVAQGVTLS